MFPRTPSRMSRCRAGMVSVPPQTKIKCKNDKIRTPLIGEL